MYASVKARFSRSSKDRPLLPHEKYEYVEKEIIIHRSDNTLSKRKMRKTLNYQLKEYLLKIDQRWIMFINLLDGLFMISMFCGSIYLYQECADVRANSVMTFLISSSFVVACLYCCNVLLSASSFVCNRSGATYARWHKKHKTDLLLCTGIFSIGLIFVNIGYAYVMFRFRPYLFDYLDSIYDYNVTAASTGGAGSGYTYLDDEYPTGPLTTCLSPSSISLIETHYNYWLYLLIFIGFVQIFRYILAWKYYAATSIDPFVVPQKFTHPDYMQVIDALDSVVFAIEEADRIEKEAENARLQAIIDEEARIQHEIKENAWKVRLAAEAEDRRLKLEAKARRRRIRRMNKMPASQLGNNYGLAFESPNPDHLGLYRAVESNQSPEEETQFYDQFRDQYMHLSPGTKPLNHPFKGRNKRKEKLKILGFTTNISMKDRFRSRKVAPGGSGNHSDGTAAATNGSGGCYDFDDVNDCHLDLLSADDQRGKRKKRRKKKKKMENGTQQKGDGSDGGDLNADSANNVQIISEDGNAEAAVVAVGGSDVFASDSGSSVVDSEENNSSESDGSDGDDDEDDEYLQWVEEERKKLMKHSTKVSVKALWKTNNNNNNMADTTHHQSKYHMGRYSRGVGQSIDSNSDSDSDNSRIYVTVTPGAESKSSFTANDIASTAVYESCAGEFGGQEEENAIQEFLHGGTVLVDLDDNLSLQHMPVKHKPTPLITMVTKSNHKHVFAPRARKIKNTMVTSTDPGDGHNHSHNHNHNHDEGIKAMKLGGGISVTNSKRSDDSSCISDSDSSKNGPDDGGFQQSVLVEKYHAKPESPEQKKTHMIPSTTTIPVVGTNSSSTNRSKTKSKSKNSKSNLADYYAMLNQVNAKADLATHKPAKYKLLFTYIIDEILDGIDYSTDNNTPAYRQEYFSRLNSRITVSPTRKPTYNKRKLILQPLNVEMLHAQLGVQPDRSSIY